MFHLFASEENNIYINYSTPGGISQEKIAFFPRGTAFFSRFGRGRGEAREISKMFRKKTT